MDQLDSVDELWRRYKTSGDRTARDRLVVHYSPLVKYVAGRVRASLPPNVDQDDLISDGVMGLLDAIDKFDVERGLLFQTYAVPRVRGAIVDGLRSSDWVPRLVRTRMRDIDRATATLEHSLQRRPSESEVAAQLGITTGELRQRYSQGSYTSLCSLDSGPGEAEEPARADTRHGHPEGLPDEVMQAIRALPERDQIVMALYYWERLSLAEIGQALQVSESRVSQIMSRATLDLRRRVA